MRSFRMFWLYVLLLPSTLVIFSCSDTKVPSNLALIAHSGAKRIGLEEMKAKSFVAGQTITKIIEAVGK